MMCVGINKVKGLGESPYPAATANGDAATDRMTLLRFNQRSPDAFGAWCNAKTDQPVSSATRGSTRRSGKMRKS